MQRLVIIFLCFSFNVSAAWQKNDITLDSLVTKLEHFRKGRALDSLKKYNAILLDRTEKDKSSYHRLVALFYYANINRFQETDAEQKCLLALKGFKKTKSDLFILRAYNTLSQINYFRGNLKKANIYNDSIALYINKNQKLNIEHQQKNEFLIGAYSNKAGNLHYFGDYENALENALLAKQYTDSVQKNYPEVDLGLAIINTSLGRHNVARQVYKGLIAKYSVANPIIAQISYNSIGDSFLIENKIDSAFVSFQKAKSIAQKNTYLEGLSTSLMKIGIVELTRGDFEKAERSLREALQISDKVKIGKLRPEILLYLGKVYKERNKISLAVLTLREAIQHAKKQKRIPLLADCYAFLSNVYEQSNDEANALLYLKESIHLKDSIKSIEVIKNTEELEKKYRTERKEKENLLLKQETAEKDLTIAQKNNVILIGFLSFIVALALIVVYYLRKYRKKNAALYRSIERREQLEKDLEIVRDNIANDFHDDLGNRLARITTLSDLMIKTSDTREKDQVVMALNKIKRDADILYDGTRDFMFSLKSKNDYFEELCTYLSDFAEEYFKPVNIDLLISKSIDEHKRLPHYWNRHIILILKEAMTNTMKHANASEVKLDFYFKGHLLYINYIDNGKGFDMDNVKSKSGIKSIRRRAKKIGLGIKITSDSLGTKIILSATL